MTENEEKIYLEGEVNAFKSIIRHCQRELRGFGAELKTTEEFSIERAEVISSLRDVCREFGDNDWDDNLHISDIINKHLIRYIEQ